MSCKENEIISDVQAETKEIAREVGEAVKEATSGIVQLFVLALLTLLGLVALFALLLFVAIF
jgi:hypothetical protein